MQGVDQAVERLRGGADLVLAQDRRAQGEVEVALGAADAVLNLGERLFHAGNHEVAHQADGRGRGQNRDDGDLGGAGDCLRDLGRIVVGALVVVGDVLVDRVGGGLRHRTEFVAQ